jgi:predicted regulator of amino acid metabolism with ACT domain
MNNIEAKELNKMENNNNDALMSNSIESLVEALIKAQSSIENVSRDKQGFGYKYADLASCLAAVKNPLADNGLSVSQIVSQDRNGKQVLVTLLMHKSGQWLKSIFALENVVMKQCNSLQQLGAGITYARRYALSAIVGLTQEDDDAQSVSSKVVEKEQGLTVVKEFMNLCAEHKLNAKDFAKFHNIDSQHSETITNGIANFNLLKEQFLNASNTITH